jgi:sugar phosphate isomerase/epimerase
MPQSVSIPAGDFAPAGVAPLILRRLSIHQTTTVRWSLGEAIREYAQAGIAGIGITLPQLQQLGMRGARRLLRESGLSVSSLGWVGGFTGANGHSYDEAVADMRSAIDSARLIGAQSLIVVTGSLAGHIRSHARRLLIEGLVEVLDQAAEAGVRLALQPMHPLFENEWTFLTSLDDALDIVQRMNHPQLGLAFGTYHLWEEDQLLKRIPEIAQQVALVQLSDWRDPPRCDNDRLLPGDGSIPLRDIVGAFESSGYTGLYEIEVWSRDLWKREHRSLMADCMARFARLMPNPT